MEGFGAFILGRNMFGPVRGEWPDDQWKGWWGDNPPYHAPTFVLTHYPRPPIEMLGGTTFHFVSDGIEDALQKAREAAGAKDVKIGGGAETVRQYIQAGHVDEIHLAVAPIALGQGNRSLAAWIFALWDIGQSSMFRRTGPRTSSSRSRVGDQSLVALLFAEGCLRSLGDFGWSMSPAFSDGATAGRLPVSRLRP